MVPNDWGAGRGNVFECLFRRLRVYQWWPRQLRQLLFNRLLAPCEISNGFDCFAGDNGGIGVTPYYSSIPHKVVHLVAYFFLLFFITMFVFLVDYFGVGSESHNNMKSLFFLRLFLTKLAILSLDYLEPLFLSLWPYYVALPPIKNILPKIGIWW